MGNIMFETIDKELSKDISEGKLEEIKQLQEAKIETMQNKENGTHN